MSAYIVAEVTVVDADVYETYKPLSAETISAHGGTYRIRGGNVESLEGEPVEGRFLIVEFPTVEAARAWYFSPEYSEARKLRTQASISRVFLVS